MSDQERKFDFMPRWPKPNIKRLLDMGVERWVVIFTDPRYPHTRYSTGHHAATPQEAWEHLSVMEQWHGV